MSENNNKHIKTYATKDYVDDNRPYCDTRTTEPAIITYDGYYPDKQIAVLNETTIQIHCFVRIHDSLSLDEGSDIIAIKTNGNDEKIENLIVTKYNEEATLIKEADSPLPTYLLNIKSDTVLNISDFFTAPFSTGEFSLSEGLWVFHIAAKQKSAESLSLKENNEVNIKALGEHYICEVEYNKVIKGNVKRVDEQDYLTTKKYVDDVVQENRFSSDYNDLENKPCYDTRVMETFNSAEDFNGDITGKVVIEEVSSASTEEITAKGTFIPKYVKMGDVAPVFSNLASNIENGNVKATCTVRYEHTDSTEVSTSELHILNENCVMLADSTWSDRVYFVYNEITLRTDTVLSPGIWYVYLDNGKGTVIYPISYSIEISDGDFKKLDYKYIDYMPGKNVTGETFTVYDNIEDFYMEMNGIYSVARTGAEIFNDKANVATGEYSHAEGAGTSAYGDYSHAEGLGSVTFKAYSHAEGYHAISNGPGSHAEGRGTISEGMWSHAENYGAYAKGWGSHAEGNSTIASGESQHVQGKFNIEDTENKYAHIVGNGQNDKKRSNVHTLDWNGNAWYQGNVSVDGIPTNDNDLTTKKYVDDKVAGVTFTVITEEDLNVIIADIDN